MFIRLGLLFIRLGWMFIVSAGLAGIFMTAFNHLELRTELTYMQAWACTLLIGTIRFMWDFEKLV